MQLGSNWAGTYDYHARELHRPESLDELRDVVARTEKIRPLGTRHSFNDLPDSTGDLVSVAHLVEDPVADAEASRVRVSAGSSYGALAARLDDEGFALHNLGSLPHISVAGACSTGTHGSGVANGALATAVRAVELVTGRGEQVRIGESDPRLGGAVVALGALGVVTALELQIEPAYEVRQDVYVDLAWDELLADVRGVMESAYSVSLFTHWTDDIAQVWLKTRVGDERVDLGGAFRGATPAGSRVMSPANEGLDNTTVQGGVPGPWYQRLPHFRPDATPSNGDEIQSEYFVPMDQAADAVRAVRRLADDIAPHLLITELRSIAADDLWLSPFNGRDSLGIHFTWMNRPEPARALLPRIEAALAPFEARPHWGKWFAMDAGALAPIYDRLGDFTSLARELDPDGQFRNGYLERVIGLS